MMKRHATKRHEKYHHIYKPKTTTRLHAAKCGIPQIHRKIYNTSGYFLISQQRSTIHPILPATAQEIRRTLKIHRYVNGVPIT
jgi:hypothetical protein